MAAAVVGTDARASDSCFPDSGASDLMMPDAGPEQPIEAVRVLEPTSGGGHGGGGRRDRRQGLRLLLPRLRRLRSDDAGCRPGATDRGRPSPRTYVRRRTWRRRSSGPTPGPPTPASPTPAPQI